MQQESWMFALLAIISVASLPTVLVRHMSIVPSGAGACLHCMCRGEAGVCDHLLDPAHEDGQHAPARMLCIRPLRLRGGNSAGSTLRPGTVDYSKWEQVVCVVYVLGMCASLLFSPCCSCWLCFQNLISLSKSCLRMILRAIHVVFGCV